MTMLHNDVAVLVKLLKFYRYWYGGDDNKSLWNSCKQFYLRARVISCYFLFAVNVTGLYYAEGFGIYNGEILYFPLACLIVVSNTLAFYSRHELIKLTATLNENFMKVTEPWMVAIKNSYTKPLWKCVKVLNFYNNYSLILTLVPFILDAIRGFQKSEYFPNYVSPLMGHNFLSVVIGCWANWETLGTLVGFMVGYAILTTYALIHVVILKESARSAQLEGTKSEIDVVMRGLIAMHNDNIELNRDLKAYLGLPCAFQTIFTSLAMTLTMFTALSSTNIPLVILYAGGFLLYLFAALLYCSLGQLLENESDEIHRTLYDLPWYRCSPDVRKSLNMIMRQSHSPLIIEYHGGYKMNFENFMDICSSAYSYFAILQTLTG